MTRTATALFALCSLSLPLGTLEAASPPNLTSDINWVDSGGEYDSSRQVFDASFGSVEDIELAYNHGRREEEKQLGLTPHTLGSLDLPSQSVWDGFSDDEKALFLVNAERTARANMKPGVVGLPLEGIEANIDAVSQAYANLLHDNDLRGHTHDGPPSFRIEQNATIGSQHVTDIVYPDDPSQSDPTKDAPATWQPTHKDGSAHFFGDSYKGAGSCHEFITRSENLAYFASTAPILMPIERSIYSFIYDDASSHWGHREAVLLQDNALGHENDDPGFTGYSDNSGTPGKEGFMGFHVRSSNRTDNPDNLYEPFKDIDSRDFDYGTVVVMNFFDPVAEGTNGCNYNVALRSEELPAGNSKFAFKVIEDNIAGLPDQPLDFNPLDNDLGELDAASLKVLSTPSKGTVSIVNSATGSMRYQPDSQFQGDDAFTYQLSNINGETQSATVHVSIKSTNNPAPAIENTDANQNASPATTSDGLGGTGSIGTWLALSLLTVRLRQKG